MGHFYQFPATSPSDGYLFSQETVAGQPPTGEVRRFRPFVGPRSSGSSRPFADLRPRKERVGDYPPQNSIMAFCSASTLG